MARDMDVVDMSCSELRPVKLRIFAPDYRFKAEVIVKGETVFGNESSFLSNFFFFLSQ